MRQPFSLLLGPLSRQARPPQRILLSPTPADQSVPDQQPLVQYKFRRGGFYQLLNRTLLYPTPADQAVPNRPPVPQYTFRPGGYWQPQKPLLFPTPADQSVPDQQIVPQYVFRLGRLWKFQRPTLWPQLTDPVIPPTPPDVVSDAVIPITAGGVSQSRRSAYNLGVPQPPRVIKVPDWLIDSYLRGEIDEEEFAVLVALQ